MTNNGTVAAIILTYNEQIHIGRALAAIQSFANQVFVIDSYSTDETVKIATSFGARVFQHPFQNNAKQFTWALENVPIQSEWVMRLDADEIIEPDLSREIREKLPLLEPGITGIYLNRKTIFQNRFLRHGGRYPMMLLRIWRTNKGRIEDRWMDEHIFLTEGRAIALKGGFADHNLFDLTFFTDKHNKYASREALDVLSNRLGLWQSESAVSGGEGSLQPGAKRFLKEHVYNRIPFEISALAYFLYRYVFRLGFLDGREGLVYHILQGFWYRFLVGAKTRELQQAVEKSADPESARVEVARLTRQKVDAP